MATIGGDAEDWRTLGGVRTAWFTAPSLTASAALGARLSPDPDVLGCDLRSTGLRVRVRSLAAAERVSATARGIGLLADPSVLQEISLVTESPRPGDIEPFWRSALGYASSEGMAAEDPPADGMTLIDPLRRDPRLRLCTAEDPRPLRQRLHLDIVRPEPVLAGLDLGPAGGPYGVRHADADGNEIDAVPGSPLGGTPESADWWQVFAAMACYRLASAEGRAELVTAAAALAEEAGAPLLVDLRAELVLLDSGKDQWEEGVYPAGMDVLDLAARIQAAARGLGAVAVPDMPRFVQLFLDAADVASVRDFWAAALGWRRDPRDGVTDLVDPRRLGPALVLQGLDPADDARRRQRSRTWPVLELAPEAVHARIEQSLAAGGSLLEGAEPGRWLLADPEGNPLEILSAR